MGMVLFDVISQVIFVTGLFQEEQLKQKAQKRDRTVLYTIVKSYSGRLFPCFMGLKVACCVPCTDEPRIKLEPGDRVLVTRWKK